MMRRRLTVPRAARRFARRLVIRQPGQAIIIGIICLIAIGTGVVTHHVSIAERQHLEHTAGLRHGYVSAVVAAGPDDPSLPPAPVLSHIADRRLHWISQELSEELTAPAEELGLQLHSRTEGAAYGSDGMVRTFIAVGADDPARALIKPLPGDGTGHTIAVRRRQHFPVEWHALPETGILGATPDGALVIEKSWIDGVIRPASPRAPALTPVANVLVTGPLDDNPFVTAYELAQRTADIRPVLLVIAWPEVIGYGRYAAASGADLLRALAIAVAVVTIAGAVAVATQNRARDIVLVRTIGFETGFIRRVYVRECALASIIASVLILAGLLAAAQAGYSVSFDVTIRRILIGGALLPPFVAFVTLRSRLGPPPARMAREAQL